MHVIVLIIRIILASINHFIHTNFILNAPAHEQVPAYHRQWTLHQQRVKVGFKSVNALGLLGYIGLAIDALLKRDGTCLNLLSFTTLKLRATHTLVDATLVLFQQLSYLCSHAVYSHVHSFALTLMALPVQRPITCMRLNCSHKIMNNFTELNAKNFIGFLFVYLTQTVHFDFTVRLDKFVLVVSLEDSSI